MQIEAKQALVHILFSILEQILMFMLGTLKDRANGSGCPNAARNRAQALVG